MQKKTAEGTRARGPASPTGIAVLDDEAESATPTATALAGEAAATGVLPLHTEAGREEIPREGQRINGGDPDTRALDNESVGDTAPGGHMMTPDQNGIDEIGEAMGMQEQDGGELHTSSEILARRDRKRVELDPPGRPASAYDDRG